MAHFSLTPSFSPSLSLAASRRPPALFVSSRSDVRAANRCRANCAVTTSSESTARSEECLASVSPGLELRASGHRHRAPPLFPLSPPPLLPPSSSSSPPASSARLMKHENSETQEAGYRKRSRAKYTGRFLNVLMREIVLRVSACAPNFSLIDTGSRARAGSPSRDVSAVLMMHLRG